MFLRRLMFASVFLLLAGAWCAPALAADSVLAGKHGNGAANVVQTDQVRAELVAHAPQGVGPGKTVWLGLRIVHQPHWHTYWKNPGDSGLPTLLDWDLPAGVKAAEIAWPTPQKIAIGRLANFGYEGTVLLPVQLGFDAAFQSPVDGSLPVKLHAQWLVCKEECVPQEGKFVLQLPTTGSTALHTAEFEAAWKAAPTPLKGTSTATIEGQSLVLRVTGLPGEWRNKALGALPETPEVLESAVVPQSSDALAAATPLVAGTQSWSTGETPTWSARIPLSGMRSAAPDSLPFVLTGAGYSLHTVATVQGTWPALASASAVAPATLPTASTTVAPGTVVDHGGLAWLVLASALLGGLILNLMPCVFPVLAIKVLAFANTQPGSSTRALTGHRAQGLAYTAGVVLSFVALGGLMLALRAGGEQLGWGFQLQSPAVIAALALLFTLLGLNLMDVLPIGQMLPSRLAGLQLRHPVADAFLSGMLAVAIASPCTAPFMGASLGYAVALPAAQALLVFATLGLGLALPYLLASWFPRVSGWLPRSGPWMQTLRRLMAFPMWATMVWLLWVLGHLSGIDGAASLLAILWCVALLAWSASQQGRTKALLTGASGAVLVALLLAVGANVVKLEPPPASPGAAGNPSADWQAWSSERVALELQSGKPVFVDFTAAWCITCQYNKKTTLEDPDVMADFRAKKVSLLRADWTRRDPAITQALGQLGRSGVPVYVLYQPGQAPRVFSEILRTTTLRQALGQLP